MDVLSKICVAADDPAGGTITLRLPVSCAFEPKEDITAFELATILQYLHGKPMFEEDLASLGVAVRHFRRI